MTLAELRDRWLSEAAHVRPYNAGAAHAFEQAARELAQLSTAEDELLSLKEAALLTGRTADHLGRLIREGKLESEGRKHAPRIRRSALEPYIAPMRSTTSVDRDTSVGYDPAADARSLRRRAETRDV